MSNRSLFVPRGVLFSAFDHLDLTLLDCSIYTRVHGKNVYKLEFYIENYEHAFPRFETKYINTRTTTGIDYSYMVGKKFTKNDI